MGVHPVFCSAVEDTLLPLGKTTVPGRLVTMSYECMDGPRHTTSNSRPQFLCNFATVLQH